MEYIPNGGAHVSVHFSVLIMHRRAIAVILCIQLRTVIGSEQRHLFRFNAPNAQRTLEWFLRGLLQGIATPVCEKRIEAWQCRMLKSAAKVEAQKDIAISFDGTYYLRSFRLHSGMLGT